MGNCNCMIFASSIHQEEIQLCSQSEKATKHIIRFNLNLPDEIVGQIIFLEKKIFFNVNFKSSSI